MMLSSFRLSAIVVMMACFLATSVQALASPKPRVLQRRVASFEDDAEMTRRTVMFRQDLDLTRDVIAQFLQKEREETTQEDEASSEILPEEETKTFMISDLLAAQSQPAMAAPFYGTVQEKEMVAGN